MNNKRTEYQELQDGYYKDLIIRTRERIEAGNPFWLRGWFKKILVAGCFLTDSAAVLTLLDRIIRGNIFLTAVVVVMTVAALDMSGLLFSRSLKLYYYGRSGIVPSIICVAMFALVFGLLAAVRFSTMDLASASDAVVSGSDMISSYADELADLEGGDMTRAEIISSTVLMTFIPMLTTVFCGVISSLSEDPLVDELVAEEANNLSLEETLGATEAREEELTTAIAEDKQLEIDEAEYNADKEKRENERDMLKIRARELLARHLAANPEELTAIADSSAEIIY